MNGATAEPEVKTIRLPSRSKQIIMGSIQNFFRSLIKDHHSKRKSPMVTSLFSKHCQFEVPCSLFDVFELGTSNIELFA